MNELGRIWTLMMVPVSYYYHGQLNIKLYPKQVPICKQDNFKLYWNTSCIPEKSLIL